MKTTKMSLANIQGKLSRPEMKKIMAGSGPCSSTNCGGTSGQVCCPGLECNGAPPNTSCQPCVWPNCPGS